MNRDCLKGWWIRLGAAALLLTGQGLEGEDKGAGEVPAAVRFVNAAGSKGRMFVLIDGQDANPAGYEAGAATGWVDFPAGKRKIEVEHEPLGRVVMEEELKAGTRHLVVAHESEAEATRPGRPMRPVLGMLRLRCEGAEGGGERRIVVVYAGAREALELRVGEKAVRAARLKPEEVTVEAGFVPVRAGEETKGEVEREREAGDERGGEGELVVLNLEEPGGVHVIVFEKADGGMEAVVVRDEG